MYERGLGWYTLIRAIVFEIPESRAGCGAMTIVLGGAGAVWCKRRSKTTRCMFYSLNRSHYRLGKDTYINTRVRVFLEPIVLNVMAGEHDTLTCYNSGNDIGHGRGLNVVFIACVPTKMDNFGRVTVKIVNTVHARVYCRTQSPPSPI